MSQKNQMPRIKSKYLFSALFLIFFCWTTFKLLEPNIFKNLTDFQTNGQKQIFNPVYDSDLINLNDLFKFGSCLLTEAGKKIVKIRSESTELATNRKKSDNSIVTKADIESHTIIVHSLNAKYNNKLKVVSEESSNKEVKNFDTNHYLSQCEQEKSNQKGDFRVNINDVTVWIDPLDATQEYSENLTEYVTVMFCIAYKGRPEAGIIHNPFSNKTVKTFFEKKPLKLTQLSETKKRVVVSRSHSGSVVSVVQSTLGKDADLITAAGSGFKALALVDDQADVYLHTGKISKWDICAPNAILNSYGGKLTKRNGEKINYSSKNNEPSLVNDGIVAAIKDHKFFVKTFKN